MALPEEFSTDRIHALRLTESDFTEFREMDKNAKLQGEAGGAWTESRSKTRFDECLAHWEKHGFGIWRLETIANGSFIGRAGLRRLHVAGKDELELAFGLIQKAWGWGMATEIAKELIQMAFKELSPESLIGLPHESNMAYSRVLEKVGLETVGDIIYNGDSHRLMRIAAPKAVAEFERVLAIDSEEPSRGPGASPPISDKLADLLKEEEDLPELK